MASRDGLPRLFQLFPTNNSEHKTTVDIIAVHGIETDASKTWLAYERDEKPKGRVINWLRDEDMLPKVVPQARIWVYDYNSNCYSDHAQNVDILGLGESFLEFLYSAKEDGIGKRPLIFIGSCFGGVVVAQALERASRDREKYKNLLRSASGIVFLGTPLRGTATASIAQWLSILRRFLKKETSNTVLKGLEENSSSLDTVVHDFTKMAILQKLQIECFYETRGTQIGNAVSKWLKNFYPSVTLVPKETATLDGHDRTELDVSHAMMNKFRGPQDGNFILVSSSLKRMVKNARIDQKRTPQQIAILDYMAPDAEGICRKEGFKTELVDESSGEWLKTSNEYQTWRDSEGGLLWCSGVAGAGKTVLAHIISKDLNARYAGDVDIQVITIFFDHDHTHSRWQYLASLWKQLAMGPLFDLDELDQLDRQYVKQRTTPDEDKWKEMLLREVRKYSRVFLIADALDESRIDDPLRFVEELVGLLPVANVLITTRPDLRIDDAKIVGKTATIEIKAHEEDLLKYVDKRISESLNLQKLCRQKYGLGDRIKQKVLKNSQGMFLLARLLMDDLAVYSNPVKVQHKLDHPPTNLNEAYDASFSRIDNQKGDASIYGREVLYTLYIAKAPLTCEQLRCVLSLEEDCVSLDPSDYVLDTAVVGNCAGLVVLDQETKVVRLGHETTRDYLHDFHSDGIAKARSALLKKCLAYLRDPAMSFEYWPENHQFHDLLLTYPFLEYAAVYWGDHARELGIDDDEDLVTAIMDLLQKDENLACATRVLVYKTSLDWISTHHWIAWGAVRRTKGRFQGINLVAYYGLDQILARILQKSPDSYLRSADPSGNVVHWAARGGHEAVLNRLMAQSGIQRIINEYNDLALTPLHIALIFSKTRALEILLNNNADPAMKVGRDLNWHSLQLAIKYGPPKHVKVLLDRGMADVLLWNRDILGRLALNIASKCDGVESLEDDIESLGILLPLYAKAIDGQHQVKDQVEDLVQELVDAMQRNPLHQAAQDGHHRATELILAHKLGQIFARGKNYRNQTPFEVAAFTGKLNVVKSYHGRVERKWLLTQYKALYCAAWRGHSEVLCELLDFFSSSPNAQHLFRKTLLCATDNGKIENVEDVTRRIDFAGNDPALTQVLFMAAERGHVEVVRHLLNIGTSVNVQNQHGSTALHLAASKHLSSVVRALLEAHSALDIVDENGRTPLSCALQNKDVVSSKLLLQSGSVIPQVEEECQGWLGTQSWWPHYSIPQQEASPSKENTKSDGDDSFSPSSADEVCRAVLYLRSALGSQWERLPSRKRLSFREILPLVNWILELAEYWIATDSQRDGEHWYDENDPDPVYLRSLPIKGRESKPVRRIVFHVTSHDQSSESGPGDFDGYTWFSVERESAGRRTGHVRLLKNKHHRREWTKFNISWPNQPGFDSTPDEPGHSEKERWLTALGRGDRVLVIPKARLQAWINFVQRVEVTIYTTCLRKVEYHRKLPSTPPQDLTLKFATESGALWV